MSGDEGGVAVTWHASLGENVEQEKWENDTWDFTHGSNTKLLVLACWQIWRTHFLARAYTILTQEYFEDNPNHPT